GTVCYMAPEQTERTGHRLGPWTDIFLLGGTLYNLLTSTPPYDHPSSRTVFEMARRGQVQPPELRAPHLEIPAELSAVCMKALSADIGARYASAQDFIQAIQDYLRGTNRRAESRAITQSVREMFVTDAAYPVLSECDNMLSQALNLWPENTEAGGLHQEVLL